MLLLLGVADRDLRTDLGPDQESTHVQPLRLEVLDAFTHVESIGSADHVLEAPESQLGHELAHLFGDEEEVVHDMLWLSGEPLAQNRILGSHPNRTGVQMAFAHHNAPRGYQRCGREAELIRTE